MKRGVDFIFLICVFIFTGCNSSSKTIGQKQTTTNINTPPDSLYPSSDLVVPYHSDWTKKHYPERIIEFKNNPLNVGDIVFLGNSLTEQAGDWGKRLNNPTIKNRGIAGDVTYGVLQRLNEIWYYKPTTVFILIGINDMFNENLTAEYIAANDIKIAEIIHSKSPQTKLYIQTILPTSNQNLVAKIKAVNDQLKSNASFDTYTLIDLHSFFSDENDLIKKELTNDGVHLTEEGYNVWVSVVREYLK